MAMKEVIPLAAEEVVTEEVYHGLTARALQVT